MSKKLKSSVLACITTQRGCDSIIRKACEIARENGAKLYVLSVQSTGIMTNEICDTLDYLNLVSRECKAEMTVCCSDNPSITAVEYIKRKRISHVVTGQPERDGKGFVSIINAVLPRVNISIAAKDGSIVYISGSQNCGSESKVVLSVR